MGRVTDIAPAGLVPAAWAVAAGADRGLLAERTLLIALLVMDILLVTFFIVGREELTGPVLGVWRRVLVTGVAVSLAGTVGLVLDPNNEFLLGVSLYGWMILPGLAYLRTGRLVPDAPYRPVYIAAGVLSILGALAYAAGGRLPLGIDRSLVGLGLVGIGQSVGMISAAVQNR